MTHTCIKPGCGKTYSNEDDDDYYCPDCLQLRASIAAEVDKKIGSTVGQKPASDLTAFDSQPKFRGFVITKL